MRSLRRGRSAGHAPELLPLLLWVFIDRGFITCLPSFLRGQQQDKPLRSWLVSQDMTALALMRLGLEAEQQALEAHSLLCLTARVRLRKTLEGSTWRVKEQSACEGSRNARN